MELKLPPPLIFLLCVGSIYLIPTPFEQVLWLQILSIPIAILGLYLDISSLLAFWRQKTTISPFSPNKTSALATDAVYRFTRNPMYLSLACYLLSLTLWFANPFGIVAISLFISLVTHFQIKPEEQILTEKFGQAYLDYQQKVRRWL